MKKGRHRRFEEARAFKRSHDVDYDNLFESLNPDDEPAKPEHDAWADVAAASSEEAGVDEPAEPTTDGEVDVDEGSGAESA